MNMERIRIALFVFTLVVIGLGSGLVAADDPENRFGLRSLKGQWGYSAFGSINAVPAAGIGRLIFDGRGLCENEATLNLGGTLVPITTDSPGGACSYTVYPDGTGRLLQEFIDPNGNSATFDITLIIVEDGQEFRFVVDDPDPNIATVGNGVAKRQRGGDD